MTLAKVDWLETEFLKLTEDSQSPKLGGIFSEVFPGVTSKVTPPLEAPFMMETEWEGQKECRSVYRVGSLNVFTAKESSCQYR